MVAHQHVPQLMISLFDVISNLQAQVVLLLSARSSNSNPGSPLSSLDALTITILSCHWLWTG